MYINYNEEKKEAQIELGHRLLTLKTKSKDGRFKLKVGAVTNKGESIRLYPENIKALRDCLSNIIDDNGI
jgi:hypothetical protein